MVVAGTKTAAVMSTEAGVTVMVTSEASTPATAATPLCRAAVSSKSLTLPLAIMEQMITDSLASGGGDGGGREGSSAGDGGAGGSSGAGGDEGGG